MTRRELFLGLPAIVTLTEGKAAAPLLNVSKQKPFFSHLMRAPNHPHSVVRAAYFNWHAFATIHWDGDHLTADDMTKLIACVGRHIGIGEGRPDSRNSSGMDWGTFQIKRKD